MNCLFGMNIFEQSTIPSVLLIVADKATKGIQSV